MMSDTKAAPFAIGDRVRYVGNLTTIYDGHIGVVSRVGTISVRVSWPTITCKLGISAFAFDELKAVQS